MSVIKVENISKQYRLGVIGANSMKDDLQRFWASVRGKEDPLLKVGVSNSLSQVANESEYIWALKNINFEVNQGEVLGIIGKNGAGKSTLLKILSKVTTPTTGQIKVKGRIASLLEVGTGFHPELTGRENIFLNGAILGMSKSEILLKFDEIVAFSGVEKYIDTPVKRYSSGMYVRLAFAVAAHLEPEILIIDEVLAVGDAEFQKKCLGKMGDVAKEGRTVLFVSHNTNAILELCSRCILLSSGLLIENDKTNLVIKKYISEFESKTFRYFENDLAFENNEYFKIRSAKIYPEEGVDKIIICESNLILEVEFDSNCDEEIYINFLLRHVSNVVVFENPTSVFRINKRSYKIKFLIPADFLNSEVYSIQFNFCKASAKLLYCIQNLLIFKVTQKPINDGVTLTQNGFVKPNLKYTID